MEISSLRPFLRYVLIFSLLIASSWVIIPGWFKIDFPRQPGPQFDRQLRKSYTKILNDGRPGIVIMGDSTMRYGVDPSLLAELTGKTVTSIDVPGSASAYWYLAIKNNLVLAKHRPQAIVIVFRETMLTAPGYRVRGGYFVRMDEYAAEDEPVLLEKAYLNEMGPVEKWAEGYFPLYSARSNIRKEIVSQIHYPIPDWLFGCDRQCVDDDILKVFTTQNLEPGQLKDAVASAEKYLYTSTQVDFAHQVDRSFLPDMIRLTQERGIQLIVIRMKSETKGKGNSDPPGLRKYIADLAGYLAEKDVIFLDYGRDPRFTHAYFKDAIHLNSQGEVLFTHVIAEGLNEALK